MYTDIVFIYIVRILYIYIYIYIYILCCRSPVVLNATPVPGNPLPHGEGPLYYV